MGLGARSLLACALAAALALCAARGRAQPSGAPKATSAESLARAKELFRSGVALMGAGDLERALDHFLRSRDAYPSGKNTANAAICLDRLGRYDEALELYEELITRFAAELDDDDRARIGPVMAALRAKVGSVAVSSNVEGLVVVDGRARGKLPLAAPIRLAAGRHAVRVLKDGYATFETTIVVAAGVATSLDAELVPLAGAGFLRVEDAANPGADVIVDRVKVGAAPWEGTLGPGRHLVWTERGDMGAPPAVVTVLEGQTALLRVRSAALGGSVRVEADPPTASITIDGLSLGGVAWDGRLAPGAHVAVATEEGYRAAKVTFTVGAAGSSPSVVRLALAIDPAHPRWPRPRAGSFFVDAFGGALLASTLRADADRACPSRCASTPRPAGFVTGLRAGFRWSGGVGVEIAGGYASIHERVARTIPTSYASSATGERYAAQYSLEDDVRVRGPFLGAGASVQRAIRAEGRGPAIGVVARLTAGVLFAGAADPLSGQVIVGIASAPVAVSGRDDVASSATLLVAPELGAYAAFGPWHVGLGLTVAFLPIGGPRLTHAQLGEKPDCPPLDDLRAPGCVPNSAAVAGERAFGPTLLWAPTASVGYAF